MDEERRVATHQKGRPRLMYTSLQREKTDAAPPDGMKFPIRNFSRSVVALSIAKQFKSNFQFHSMQFNGI
jgi:hypothetical protein